MGKQKGFSYYDIEEFLRDAGATRINEAAIKSFEEELKDTIEGIVEEAETYASHAGRSKKITFSDIDMARTYKVKKHYIIKSKGHKKRAHIKQASGK